MSFPGVSRHLRISAVCCRTTPSASWRRACCSSMIVVAAKGGEGKLAGVGAGEWGLDGGRRGVEQGTGCCWWWWWWSRMVEVWLWISGCWWRREALRRSHHGPICSDDAPEQPIRTGQGPTARPKEPRAVTITTFSESLWTRGFFFFFFSSTLHRTYLEP